MLHYVNPTLEESEFDVAIIHVCVNDLLNCRGDTDQINNILRNMEHIVCKCRQYGVKNIFSSGLTIMNRLPEQLIKDFDISISIFRYCDNTDNATVMLNEVCRDGLLTSGKRKYVLINNYLDKICQNFS